VAGVDPMWGVISDIHGNRAGLEAIQQSMRSLDLAGVVCCGDLVGYNTHSSSVIDSIMDASIPCVLGNHDALLISDPGHSINPVYSRSIALARESMRDDQHGFLLSLPTTLTCEFGSVQALMLHGRPGDPIQGYFYPNDIKNASLPDETDFLIVGHTHLQFTLDAKNGQVLNPGSCGLQRDGDPRPAFAILNGRTREVRASRVLYDCSSEVISNRANDLPSVINDHLILGQKSSTHVKTDLTDDENLLEVGRLLNDEGFQVVSNCSGLLAEFDSDGDKATAVVVLAVLDDSSDSLVLRSSPFHYKWRSSSCDTGAQRSTGRLANGCEIRENPVGYFLEFPIHGGMGTASIAGITDRLCLLRESFLALEKIE